MERIRLLAFADAQHVLGQVAVAHDAPKGSKLESIFDNACLRAEHDRRMLTFEMNRIERALEGSGISPVLLKGAAYVALELKAGQGRRVSDIDILVAEDELAAVEAALKAAGWAPEESTASDYDQDYYRRHMHELPPLRHVKRGSIIDVHHRLLPRTARIKLDSAVLLANAVPLEGTRLATLDPADIFIHAAVHAFADGAFDTPARSLIELNLLFTDLPPAALDGLVARARDVGAVMPVSMALWAVAALFGNSDARKLSAALPHRRYPLLKWAIKAKTADRLAAPFAKAWLYVRSHWLRMPLHLLLPHLMRKALQWRPASQEPVKLPHP